MPHYKLPIFHFLIPPGFVLGQAEKEGRQGGWANGDVVHSIAGINDDYNKIAFINHYPAFEQPRPDLLCAYRYIHNFIELLLAINKPYFGRNRCHNEEHLKKYFI